MCLIAFAIQEHPRYPLIIAANRDEFYHRPTAPLGFWPDHPDILAGRDLSQKGTWLGITKNGKFAAITNFREPALTNPHAPSRGWLVSRFLVSDQHPKEYLETIKTSGKNYNGFNLLVGDVHQLWWYSNKKQEIVKTLPGIHVISNRFMDTPWPKSETIKSSLQTICSDKLPVDKEDIFRILADTKRPPDDQLPHTGVGLDWERILSSVFVSSEIYGTRSSAVILLDRKGQLTFSERTFTPCHKMQMNQKTQEFTLSIPKI